jgi:vanillate O-demethylase ferredoxin subunit
MTLRLRITAAAWEAPNIHSYELRAVEGSELPSFTAGSHIDITLPIVPAAGLVRSYSLLNPQSERHRYVVGVQKDRASRGGSQWIHEHFRVGEIVDANGPRNNFPVDENAAKSLFIAGGIGITPILSMIERLSALGRDWELVYCSRRRAGTAFLQRLEGRPQVRFNFDEEPGAKMLDIAALVSRAPAGGHLYCCGPLPMLDAFEQATKGLPRERVHVEYFTAKEAAAREGGFTVVLKRSGRELTVTPGKTILDVLREGGIDVPHSCTEGICGTCETKVLEGVPDHRDLILTEAERAANKSIMVCCSGSRTPKLVLDL